MSNVFHNASYRISLPSSFYDVCVDFLRNVNTLVYHPVKNKWIPFKSVVKNPLAFNWVACNHINDKSPRPQNYKLVTEGKIQRGDLISNDNVNWYFTHTMIGENISATTYWTYCARKEVKPKVTVKYPEYRFILPEKHFIISTGEVKKGDYVLNPHDGWESVDAMIGENVEKCPWKVCRHRDSLPVSTKPKVKAEVKAEVKVPEGYTLVTPGPGVFTKVGDMVKNTYFDTWEEAAGIIGELVGYSNFLTATPIKAKTKAPTEAPTKAVIPTINTLVEIGGKKYAVTINFKPV